MRLARRCERHPRQPRVGQPGERLAVRPGMLTHLRGDPRPTRKQEAGLPEMGKSGRAIAETRADWDANFPRLLEAYRLALARGGKMTGRACVAIVQARMGSTRLPGKVLADIGGVPMLVGVVECAAAQRGARRAGGDDADEADDDALETFAGNAAIRSIAAARTTCSTATSRRPPGLGRRDRPADGRLPAARSGTRRSDGAHLPRRLASGRPGRQSTPGSAHLPDRTRHRGRVCRALEQAWREATEPHQREHVLPYLYDPPGRFRVVRLDAEKDYGALRWTVDTPQDLEFVRQVVSRLDRDGAFGWRDVLALVQAEPSLALINADVPHKTHRDVG